MYLNIKSLETCFEPKHKKLKYLLFFFFFNVAAQKLIFHPFLLSS